MDYETAEALRFAINSMFDLAGFEDRLPETIVISVYEEAPSYSFSPGDVIVDRLGHFYTVEEIYDGLLYPHLRILRVIDRLFYKSTNVRGLNYPITVYENAFDYLDD